MIVVSDTSPVRALQELGRLELLRDLFGEVLAPPAVREELANPRSRFKPLLLEDWPFITVKAPQDHSAVRQLLGKLHLGEAEAIVLAGELRADLVLIDEVTGRAVAEERGLVVVGVLGTLLRAKRKGLLAEVGPLVLTLERELGFFISPDLRQQVLRQAGE